MFRTWGGRDDLNRGEQKMGKMILVSWDLDPDKDYDEGDFYTALNSLGLHRTGKKTKRRLPHSSAYGNVPASLGDDAHTISKNLKTRLEKVPNVTVKRLAVALFDGNLGLSGEQATDLWKIEYPELADAEAEKAAVAKRVANNFLAKQAKQNACLHPRKRKEYIAGMDTGDKICVDCGAKL